MPPFHLSEVETKIIRKRQIHNYRMTECLNSGCIIVNDQIILSALVVFLILKGEPHPKDPLLRIGITNVSDVRVLIGNLFIIL